MRPRKIIPETPVTDFLNSYPNKKTRENYRVAITHFLHTVCRSSRSGKFAKPDVLAVRYFDDLNNGVRNHFHDLKSYGLLLTEKYAPTTTSLYLSLASIWLDENGYPLTRREKFRISALLPPPYPLDREVEIKRSTFRAIYNALPEDVSVLFLVQIASGMRLGEALALRKSDVDWDGERVEIKIPADITKTKAARTTYLTEEAGFVLLEYLQSRRDDDERLFLISCHQAQKAMRDASRDMGFTHEINGRKVGVHWHMTRKWFISRFSLVASKDVAEHLAGHEGYLSRSYRRYSKKQALKEYQKAEAKLSILREYEVYYGLGGI